MPLRQAHDDAVADSIDDVNRSRQDMQVVCITWCVICCIFNLFEQLDAGKKLQQLHRRQLQLQHSVVVVQVKLFAPF